MRKLLVVVLASLVVVGLFAAEKAVSGSVSWSGSVSFTAIADEKGIDVTASVGVYVTWSWDPLSASAQTGKVTASVSWGFNSTGYASLGSIAYENDALKMEYTQSGISGDAYFANGDDGLGNDKLAVTIKAANITVYYVDLVEETDTNTGKPVEFDKYFNDYIALEGGFGPVDFFGAFYDTTDSDATPAYEYGAALYLSGEKIDEALKGLSVEAAFGMPAGSSDPSYGVIVSYSKDLEFDPVTLSLSNTFKYTQNLVALKYNTVSDAKSDEFSVSAEANIESFSVSAGVDGSYDLDSAALGLGANAGLKGSFDVASFGVEVEIPDVLNKANEMAITGNVSVSVDPISLYADGKYLTADGSYAYGAKVTYKFDESLSFCAFYGTYYDKDADGVKDMNMDDPQWYVKMTFSATF